MTRQEDIEMRHPSKLAVHSIVGFHKADPEYLDLHKALMQRFQIYGIEPTYVE